MQEFLVILAVLEVFFFVAIQARYGHLKDSEDFFDRYTYRSARRWSTFLIWLLVATLILQLNVAIYELYITNTYPIEAE